MDYYVQAYSAVVLISTVAMIVPLFLSESSYLHDQGILPEVLKFSVVLKILESVSIGCTLPMLTDIVLDRFTKSRGVTLDIVHRTLFSLTFSLASAAYLFLCNYSFMPILYIFLYRTKVLLMGAVTFYVVSDGAIATKFKIKWIFFVPVLSCAVLFTTEIYCLVFPDISYLPLISFIMSILALVSFFLVHILWVFSLWRQFCIAKVLENSEVKEFVYMMFSLFYIVACQIVAAIYGSPLSWLDTGENILSGYIVVQILCLLFASVLPGRVIRQVAELTEAMLQLKKEFVRYISHEIRSPLNVVHAGLELLKFELEATGVLHSISELFEDIYLASNTAIDVLDEMLQYEHIDSGTFKLDCVAVRLFGCFVGRLDGFMHLALRKNILLRIDDFAQVSESPICSIERNSKQYLNQLERDGDFSLLMLYIDKFRVEQIIRNLLTNAFKFAPEGSIVTICFRILEDNENLFPLSLSASGKCSLDVGLKTSKFFLRIEVVDSGAGISPEEQAHLRSQCAEFNRYSLQGAGGPGLGLWICRNLATYHGGRMDFSSDGVGKGSTFWVDLPLFTKNQPKPASGAESPYLFPASIPSPTSRRVCPLEDTTNLVMEDFPRAMYSSASVSEEAFDDPWENPCTNILIVDDSSTNRKIVRKMVEGRLNRATFGDVHVVEADDGSSALEVMTQYFEREGQLFDFVLMDFIMTRMNGPEAAQRMRKDLHFAGSIIGVTGNALPDDIAYFMESGADCVVTKPLTNKKLMDAILLAKSKIMLL